MSSGILTNDIPKYLFFLAYLGLNTFLFVHFYRFYNEDPQFFYTKVLLGPALPLARAPAACLNLNCLLVLLPICRNLLSYFRRLCMCCPRRIRRLLGKNIKFHRICAYMIVLMTLIHLYAHCFNVDFFTSVHEIKLSHIQNAEEKKIAQLKLRLAQIGDLEGETYLDPIRESIWSVVAVFLLTGGWTGLIITLSLFFMVSSSVEFIRRSYFEVFWFTHHLFTVFYGFLVIHGVSMQVRGQTSASMKQHNVTFCYTVPEEWGNIPQCPIPKFAGSAPGTWKWVIAPMILYGLERSIRFARSCQNVEILKVIAHPSRVIELQMRKKSFEAEVGQYVFIKCSQLSHLEWHPFTLTSAPEENYCSVHIRVAGDWTAGLSKLVCDESGAAQQGGGRPKIAIDGPFGTASEDVFTYPVAICVGSGIGVTPFASLLKSVWYKNLNPETSAGLKLEKVYFFWICPEIHAFEWFGDMLSHLEHQLAEIGRQDLIEYHIYLTRGWDAKQAKAIFVAEEDQRDVITGLEQKTNYGRPNWEEIFAGTARKHPSCDIGVFFCGVAALSHMLHKMSNKHSGNGVTFHYNKENF